jgi:hypothetical protein
MDAPVKPDYQRSYERCVLAWGQRRLASTWVHGTNCIFEAAVVIRESAPLSPAWSRALRLSDMAETMVGRIESRAVIPWARIEKFWKRFGRVDLTP